MSWLHTQRKCSTYECILYMYVYVYIYLYEYLWEDGIIKGEWGISTYYMRNKHTHDPTRYDTSIPC